MSVADNVRVMLLKERAEIDAVLKVIGGATTSVLSPSPMAATNPEPATKKTGRSWSPEHRARMMAARAASKAKREAEKSAAETVVTYDHSAPADESTEAAQ